MRYFWIGLVADYGTLALIWSLPALLREVWETSTFNLLHRFTGECDGRFDDIRLFKRSICTIECKHDPPAPCNDNGVCIGSYCFLGRWHEQEEGFRLEGYDGQRSLTIRFANGKCVTTEAGYPSDRAYRYDMLDARELTKIR